MTKIRGRFLKPHNEIFKHRDMPHKLGREDRGKSSKRDAATPLNPPLIIIRVKVLVRQPNASLSSSSVEYLDHTDQRNHLLPQPKA
jgi:hypothetical protein